MCWRQSRVFQMYKIIILMAAYASYWKRKKKCEINVSTHTFVLVKYVTHTHTHTHTSRAAWLTDRGTNGTGGPPSTSKSFMTNCIIRVRPIYRSLVRSELGDRTVAPPLPRWGFPRPFATGRIAAGQDMVVQWGNVSAKLPCGQTEVCVSQVILVWRLSKT